MGVSIGSFINVVLIRLPENLSVLYPRSSCTKCKKQILWYDNIPILSWLILKGRCRFCKESFSINYLLIELLFGLIFLYVKFNEHTNYEGLTVTQNNILSWIFLTILIPLFILDYKYLWLPSSVIYLGISIGALFITIYSYFIGSPIFFNNFLAAILGFLIFKALSIIGGFILKKKVLGEGDAKLALFMGIWLGIKGLIASLYFAFVSAGLLCIVLLNLKMIKRNSKIPFGPFMISGALLAWFYDLGFIYDYLK